MSVFGEKRQMLLQPPVLSCQEHQSACLADRWEPLDEPQSSGKRKFVQRMSIVINAITA